MNETQWLSISVFCKRRNYHKVLREGIQPFIEKNMANHLLSSWFIEFNTLRGEHIRFPMLVEAGQAFNVVTDLKKHFILYFDEIKLPTQNVDQPINGLFLPFPENSVQFGLYSTPSGDRVTKSNELRQKISEILLEALGDEEIDDDKILTLCLYLHFTLLKCYSEKFPGNSLFFNSYCKSHTGRNKDAAVLSFLNEKLEDNRDVTMEICKDMLLSEKIYQDYRWLYKWRELCVGTNDKEGGYDTEILLMDLLHRQLNVSSGLFEIAQLLVSSTWNAINPT